MGKNKDKKKKKKLLYDPGFLVELVVGIGEVSEMTGVPQRQLRYWQEKGVVGILNERSNTTRKFDYYAVRKIRLIREFLEKDGATLDEAAARAEEKLASLKKALEKYRLKHSTSPSTIENQPDNDSDE
jgi:DNA-binding transcriptional MerR regulator